MLMTISADPIRALSLAIFVGALLAAAVWDLRLYIIPNTLQAAVAVAFALFALTRPPHETAMHVALGLGVLAAGAFCFARGWMGGGDVKLLAATSLWAGPPLFSPFILVTAVAGGMLGLLLLTPAYRLLPRAASQPIFSSSRTSSRLRAPIPYGVAIAIGGLWVATQLAIS